MSPPPRAKCRGTATKVGSLDRPAAGIGPDSRVTGLHGDRGLIGATVRFRDKVRARAECARPRPMSSGPRRRLYWWRRHHVRRLRSSARIVFAA